MITGICEREVIDYYNDVKVTDSISADRYLESV